jgi:MFS transporter, ACS family, tartrate transporter
MSNSAAQETDATLPARTLRAVFWRLVPFLCFLYVLNLLDRTNVSFARLTMLGDLSMSQSDFDWGYGIFYLGYLAFEVPSNLLLRRVGARRWIARIMITWGLVTCVTAAVTGAWSFYGVRILLGIAEAGFFPGIVLYLTFWFPAPQRGRIMAWFMTANAVAGVVGQPLSGAIMQFLDGAGGLHGWQWLFVLEGIPSIIIGGVVFVYLNDGPAAAHWLEPAERDWLCETMRQEEQSRQERHGADLFAAFTSPRVWLLIGVYFTVAVGANAAGAYLPTLLKDRFTNYTKFEIGLLAAVPHLCAIVAMTLFGAYSDRTGRRNRHVAAAAFLAAAGWTLSASAGKASAFLTSTGWTLGAVTDEPLLALIGFCLAQAGMMSMLPIFWTIPTSFLSGAAAAGGIALINSVANLGGFLGPTILGQFGLWAMVAVLATGGCLALCVRYEVDLRNQ